MEQLKKASDSVMAVSEALPFFLVPKLQLGNAIATKAPALSGLSGASCTIHGDRLGSPTAYGSYAMYDGLI